MKKLLYSFHSKWSLIAAMFPRLWFYEETLWRNFPSLWQYRLELPHKDYVIFFPYIVSVRGWQRKTVKDPINIAAYGVGREEFASLLMRSNPKWHQFLGSSYFLYGPARCGWRANVSVKLDITKEAKERHHIRLFELKTRRGEKVTLGSAHYDRPYHAEEEPPLSWNETRDLAAHDIHALCGLSEQVTKPNWRDAEGDGKILIINCKKYPRG